MVQLVQQFKATMSLNHLILTKILLVVIEACSKIHFSISLIDLTPTTLFQLYPKISSYAQNHTINAKEPR